MALGLGAWLLFARRLAKSPAWRATGTPLASIMGSGFLVCAPLLYQTVGNAAVLAMLALLIVAYGVGGAIRFNIAHAEPLFAARDDSHGAAAGVESRLHAGHALAALHLRWRGVAPVLEKLSHIALACAYVISVTYYLQLLAAFVLEPFGVRGGYIPRLLTTSILAGISVIGTLFGLRMLERIERYVLSINLAMIGALVAGLAWHNAALALHGSWHLPPAAGDGPVHTARVLMGLLIVVQGFETSRFLGAEHDAQQRIRTMRYAQLISTGVYIAFIALVTPLLSRVAGGAGADVTAIVNIGRIVAVVLPALILIAAAGSQFSAAVADDAGCAGLVQGMLGKRAPGRAGYAAIGAATIALTWVTDVFQIISLASRAFALFYALQCTVACVVAWNSSPRATCRALLYAALALLCAAITLLGIPAS